MRILVTGARGLLGTPTCETFRARGDDVLALDRAELDITDGEAVSARISEFRPDVVINCAGYTRVDDCETCEGEAIRVNAHGAAHVAAAAHRAQAGLIHISTDYIFRGDAREPIPETAAPAEPSQLSAYGRSKRLGEQLVQQAHPAACIVRTAWLFGENGPCFPRAILDRAHAGHPLRVVNDQTGSPTYACDLALALAELAARRATGVFHVSNAGICTWFDFAREIIRQSGLNIAVTPCTTAEFPRPARRPAYSVLDNRRYIQLVGRPLRPWPDALTDFL
jgi:dTDP-4-dehydrorhamnose reductase